MGYKKRIMYRRNLLTEAKDPFALLAGLIFLVLYLTRHFFHGTHTHTKTQFRSVCTGRGTFICLLTFNIVKLVKVNIWNSGETFVATFGKRFFTF